MALKHFVRLEREVYLGGLKWLRGRGGRWYTTARTTPLTWNELVVALRAVLGLTTLAVDVVGTAIESMPIQQVRPLLRFLVVGPIRPKDLQRTTSKQVACAWRAFAEVNHVDYLLHGTEPRGRGDTELDLADQAYVLSEALFGVRLPRELLMLPACEFLAMLESRQRVDNVRHGRPADAVLLTEEERAAASRLFLDGIEVC